MPVELWLHGWRASVVGPPALLDDIAAVCRGMRSPVRGSTGACPATTRFEVEVDRPRPDCQQITRDGTPLWDGPPAEVLAHLEWAINRAAAEWLGQRCLLFHAGAIAYAGRGLILPAPSGGGKTTLVAGLVAAGFDYFSDEVATIDPRDLALRPFPKSLCVKAGGRTALAALYPRLLAERAHRRFGGEPVWYLPPPYPAVAKAAVPIRYVVLPTYRPWLGSSLQPVARSVALRRLLAQSFNLSAHGAPGVRRLVETLRGADCYELSVGTLAQAVELLRGLIQVQAD